MGGYIIYVYADLIRKGEKTLEQIPAKIRDEVTALVEVNQKDDK